MLVNISEKQFTWPNQILYEGRLITRSTTEPNFALYMTSSGMMNKKIYVTREQFQRFFDGVVSNRQKKRERENMKKLINKNLNKTMSTTNHQFQNK